MSSIINQSKWIVTVKRRPDLARAFPHYKEAEAKDHKEKLLKEHRVVADIARGPLKLLVRIRSRGRSRTVPVQRFTMELLKSPSQ
jgi:hypothetical protein